jgi:hypothetical protein
MIGGEETVVEGSYHILNRLEDMSILTGFGWELMGLAENG